MLRIPAIQGHVGSAVSDALGKTLGTKVQVERVDIRLLNRIVTDNVTIYDQQSKQMLRASRISAAIDLMPLLYGEVSISSAQLFGARIALYRNDSESDLNCQFVIDSLASRDTTSHTPLNLSIGSLIIRNGSITFDQHDKARVNGRFSPYHINAEKVSSHIILYKLTDDSLNVTLKKLSFNEASGIQLKHLSAEATVSKGNVSIKDFALQMPETEIKVPFLKARYAMDGKKIRKGSLQFEYKFHAPRISPSDLSMFLPDKIAQAFPVVSIHGDGKGTDSKAAGSMGVFCDDGNTLQIILGATVSNLLENPTGEFSIGRLFASEKFIGTMQKTFDLPEILTRLGDVEISSTNEFEGDRHITTDTRLWASNIGTARLDGEYNGNDVHVKLKSPIPEYRKNAVTKVEPPVLDLGRLLDDKRLGTLKCDIEAKVHLNNDHKLTSAALKGVINEVTYNNYTYHDIKVDGTYDNETIKGLLDIDDPNVRLTAEGSVGIGRKKSVNATVTLADFAPKALNMSNDFGNDVFSLDMEADMKGSSIDNAEGSISIRNIRVTNEDSSRGNAFLNDITIKALQEDGGIRTVELLSDFAIARMEGDISLSKIPQSFTNLIASELSFLPGLKETSKNNNNFNVNATVYNIDFIKRLVSIPVEMGKPLTINGFINSIDNKANVRLYAPSLTASGKEFSDTELLLWTPDDEVKSSLETFFHDNNGTTRLNLDCTADDNDLHSVLSWDNQRSNTFRGKLNTITHFYKSMNGNDAFSVSIPQSSFEVGDTVWSIHSDGISYEDNVVTVNRFDIGNENQHVFIDGVLSKSQNDSIIANLRNVNVGYVLDLVNFTSVSFDGKASGTVVAHGVLDELRAKAHLDVKNFLFQEGRMGTLHADATYSNESKQIDIDAYTDDPEVNGRILIDGNISPQRNDIDLNIQPSNARLEFMQSFCGSFMKDVDLLGCGKLRLFGPFKTINLEGQMVADGSFTITPTNCRYTMVHDTITLVPNDIRFHAIPLKDKYGNTVFVSGGIHHRYLGRISYDIVALTQRILAYDFPTLNGNTFCGHATINGEIGIHGAGNELNITADATPLEGSYIVYDASSPDAITSQDFITWRSANAPAKAHTEQQEDLDDDDINNAGNNRTNIRMDLMINANTDTKLHVLMDATTGDYVDLFGSGALRVSFYNKGGLEIFGNYAVDHGTYKMTIQNLLRRDFAFQKGGNITFGGNPYHAALNLQAAYMLNSVSLSDLNIGSSFKSNNVPVNCLMNITGTPEKPEVTFDLDLPSLGTDAREMVYSVINSQEEMNQQVLYLLGIGRFYSQSGVGSSEERSNSQSSLAMQSFISGTITQQLNNMLGQLFGSNNWSFGANITPGADGFNNAEYEGLLNGRMFNNRLHFNGQFGYRDNIRTNSQNFIGDFTLQYLLTPNGNVALKVYNQSNDRYFTRSSLNTQGIGILLQKEFGK